MPGPRTEPIAPPLPVAGGFASVIPFIMPQGCEIRAVMLTSVAFTGLLASPLVAIAANVVRLVPTVWAYGEFDAKVVPGSSVVSLVRYWL